MQFRPNVMLPNAGDSLRFEKGVRRPMFSVRLHDFEFTGDDIQGIVRMVEVYRKANRIKSPDTKREVVAMICTQHPELFQEALPPPKGDPVPQWLKAHLDNEARAPLRYGPWEAREPTENGIKDDFRADESGKYSEDI